MRKLPCVLILWGVPGVGKSTFADFLVAHEGFVRIDSDAGGGGDTKAARAWRRFLAGQGSAQEFMEVAGASRQPIVLEFGMFATAGAIALLERMRQAGAAAWWFDGDRDAAFEAWKQENRKSGRVFDIGERKWDQVVGMMNFNWPLLAALFGTNIVRTIEAGPAYVPPTDTLRTMFGDSDC